MGFRDKLDDVTGDAGERIGKAGERVGETGLAVGQRVAATGATATRAARERGTDLSERLGRIDPKEAADSAAWGFQAGSRVPGGPYSTALGTGLGAAYGAYSSVREDALDAAEAGIEIEVEDEGEPIDRPVGAESMGAIPGNGVGGRLDGVLPRNLDLERASAMALSSYDWYKQGRDRWGTKGGVAGAAFGVARHLATGGDGDDRPEAEPPR